MFRKVKSIGNPRDNEYINEVKIDPDLEPGKNVTRCVNDDIKEYYLDLSGIKDLSNLVTADYKFFEIPPPPPPPPKGS